MNYIDNNAKNYGDALFMLAKELNEIDTVKADFDTLCEIIVHNQEYLKLLDTPSLSREERVKLVDTAFGTLNKNLVNMLKILSERRLAYLICKIREAYIVVYEPVLCSVNVNWLYANCVSPNVAPFSSTRLSNTTLFSLPE